MIIFWPIRPLKLFRNRHIHTIIINRTQSIEHILQKNFIIMRVSVKFFPNFIAIITRLELYGKNRGNSNSNHSSVKICIASKICDEKLFFLDLDERVPRYFLWEISFKEPIDHQSRVRFYHLVFARYRRAAIESFRKKSTNENRCILALWNCTKNSIFPVFSPFWKFWKILARWNKYIWIEEYILSNNFFEKFAKI